MNFKHLTNFDIFRKTNKILNQLIIKRYAVKSLDIKVKQSKNWSNSLQYFINNNKVIKLVLKHLSNDLANDESFIFVSSVGTGLLVHKLLESGAQKVRVFEDIPQHLDALKKLEALYPNRLDVIDKQIINLPLYSWKNWETDELDVNNWFRDVTNNGWHDFHPIKFVAVLTPYMSTIFMRSVIRQLTQKDLFFSFGRTQFLVFVSEKENKFMTAKHSENMNDYRACTVLYQTLFDIETLATINFIAFDTYPERPQNLQKDEGKAKLIRMTPKPCLDSYDSEMLMDYHYFVTQILMKRKNWIIPYLEKWFPNCGPDLIKMRIPVFKYFGDLSPQQIFDLFCHFYSQPNYESSLFKSNAISKRYAVEDEEVVTEVTEETNELSEIESDNESDKS